MKRYAAVLMTTFLIVTIFALLPSAASASTLVPGLDQCHPGAGCHTELSNEPFPNYKSVCSDEDCNFVSAANWEQAGIGVSPGISLLKSEYNKAAQAFSGGLSMPDLWNYWTNFGVDGIYLSSYSPISTNESVIENAVRDHRAVLAESTTQKSSYVGTRRFDAGTQIMIADGYTPKGPLIVFQGRTMQMTWAQWNVQVQSVWEIDVSRVAPTIPPTTVPPSTTTPTATLTLNSTTVPSTGATVTLTFSSKNATSCELTSVPSFWTSSDVVVDCNGTYQIDVPSSSENEQWIFTFTANNSTGQDATATQTLVQTASQPTAPSTSTNWSGYIVPSSTALITDAQADWTVPTLNCSDTPVGAVAVWVGIGGGQLASGSSSGPLLQTGVSMNCTNGVQENQAWWELVPATPNNEQAFTSFPVSSGDQIETTVYETTNNAWQTEVTDVNTGLSAYMITGESWGVGTTSSNTFSIQGSAAQISYTGGYTAEWIVEDPEDAATQALVPFANFGFVTFTNLECSVTSWSLTPSETSTIVQNAVTLATPTTSTSDGFTDTYTGP